MNKLLNVLALGLVVLIAACRKGGEDTGIPGKPVEDAFAFKIEGLHDTTIERIDELKMSLSVKLLAGKTETVRLGVADLPQGMTAVFSQRSGEPSFVTVMTLQTNKTLEGVHSIYITDTGKYNTVSLHKMNIKVVPYSNDAVAFNGEYKEIHECSETGASTFPVYIQPVNQFPNRITIKGFWTQSWSTVVYADLDPEHKTVNLPTQQGTAKVTFHGIGTYNDNEIVINYTVVDSTALVNESCTATFRK